MKDEQQFDEQVSAETAYERRYFTQAEAEALVGKRVRSLVDFSGVPRGTTGMVTQADPAGRAKSPFDEPVETFSVAIQWKLPVRPPSIASGTVGGEPFVFVNTGRSLTDWFSRDEYERYLTEVG